MQETAARVLVDEDVGSRKEKRVACLRLCEPAPSRYHNKKDGTRHKRREERMRTREEITEAVEAHADDVLRACAVYMREQADREDAFQETFLRFARSSATFTDIEHRKAWLIRVAVNVCKDMLKSAAYKTESLDQEQEHGVTPVGDDGQEAQRSLESEELLRMLDKLEEKYRIVLHLKYYEGYSAAKISQVTGMPENTVYTNLARGRRKLLEMMGHE